MKIIGRKFSGGSARALIYTVLVGCVLLASFISNCECLSQRTRDGRARAIAQNSGANCARAGERSFFSVSASASADFKQNGADGALNLRKFAKIGAPV